jgi:hypothetical protein
MKHLQIRRTDVWARRAAALLVALSLAAAHGCQGNVKGGDSESHFMRCGVDSTCLALGEAYRCVAGRCRDTSADGSAGAASAHDGAAAGTLGSGGVSPSSNAPSSGAGGASPIVTPQPDSGCIPPADVRIDFSSTITRDAGARDGAAEGGVKEAGTVLDAGVFACSVELPPARPSFDPNKVNVAISTAANQRYVLNVRDRAACAASEPSAEEWYYDDPARPTRIAFCPDTCDRFRSTGVTIATVVYGCPVDLPP